MADAKGSGRVWWVAGGLLLASLLIGGGLLVMGGPAGDGAGGRSGNGEGPGSDPGLEGGGPDGAGGPDGSPGSTAFGGSDPEAAAEAAKKAEALAADPTEGPTGELTAVDLPTAAIAPPGGRTSLIAPQFSPSGKRILAVSGNKSTAAVWFADADDLDGGWRLVPGEGATTDPVWLTDDVMVVVMNGRLHSYKVGGRLFEVVPESDEPGEMSDPAAAAGGQLLAYVSTTQTNNGDLKVVDRGDGVVRSLTASAAREAQPAWRSDGQAVVGTLGGQVTAWSPSQSGFLVRHPRNDSAVVPGWWGQRLHWQEGTLVVNVVVAEPDQAPRIIARKALGSIDRPAPVVADHLWVASLTDPGTLWALRPDGSAVLVDSDSPYASQPDVVERPDGIWLAFTNNDRDQGLTEVRVGKLSKQVLQP